jgi:cytochrome c
VKARITLTGLSLVAVALAFAAPDEVGGGKELFQRRCGGCHSLDRPMEGPRLRGVVGRTAGSTKDFEYSQALRNSKIVWSEELLDKWLTDTESVVKENDMSFRVPRAEERRAIIAYLRDSAQGDPANGDSSNGNSAN